MISIEVEKGYPDYQMDLPIKAEIMPPGMNFEVHMVKDPFPYCAVVPEKKP